MVLALLLGSSLRRLPLLVSQIMSHLGPKHPFVQPLAQLLHDPSRTGQIFRSLVALHQLFDDCRIYPRLFAFLALRFLLLLLGHFHLLLPQVVTHTQILGHPHWIARLAITIALTIGARLPVLEGWCPKSIPPDLINA